jgi:transposase
MHLVSWLQQHGVTEVVMESTAQYWKPVWYALEPHFALHLAQAWSNRAPRGKKADFQDAERLVRRYWAGELTLSFIPDAEQRLMRDVTRRRAQLTRDRVRIQNQVESLLEETRIKLSSAVTDLFGATGRRILQALVTGVSDAQQLAALADPHVKRSPEELTEALTGVVTPIHRLLLAQHLKQLELVDAQLQELTQWTAKAMQNYGDVIARLSEIPGIRVKAAEQLLAEVGPEAKAFPTAARFSSWIGVCPGKNESAEQNHSSRSAKGNKFVRTVLVQAAHAAVRTKDSFFQRKFNALLPKKGYPKAIWAVAHHMAVVIWHILHNRAHYQERGGRTTKQALQRRLQRLNAELRRYGVSAVLQTLEPAQMAVSKS